MAKAVSTLISISLLIGVDRAAEYWQRTHNRENAVELNSHWAQASADSNSPRILPTNLAVKAGAILFPFQQP